MIISIFCQYALVSFSNVIQNAAVHFLMLIILSIGSPKFIYFVIKSGQQIIFVKKAQTHNNPFRLRQADSCPNLLNTIW